MIKFPIYQDFDCDCEIGTIELIYDSISKNFRILPIFEKDVLVGFASVNKKDKDGGTFGNLGSKLFKN